MRVPRMEQVFLERKDNPVALLYSDEDPKGHAAATKRVTKAVSKSAQDIKQAMKSAKDFGSSDTASWDALAQLLHRKLGFGELGPNPSAERWAAMDEVFLVEKPRNRAGSEFRDARRGGAPSSFDTQIATEANDGPGPEASSDVGHPPHGHGLEASRDVSSPPKGKGLEASMDLSPWATGRLSIFQKDKDVDPDPPGLTLAI